MVGCCGGYTISNGTRSLQWTHVGTSALGPETIRSRHPHLCPLDHNRLADTGVSALNKINGGSSMVLPGVRTGLTGGGFVVPSHLEGKYQGVRPEVSEARWRWNLSRAPPQRHKTSKKSGGK